MTFCENISSLLTVCVNKHLPSHSWKDYIHFYMPSTDLPGVRTLTDFQAVSGSCAPFFKQWIEVIAWHTGSNTVLEIQPGKLLVLTASPVIVFEPDWWSHLMGKFQYLLEYVEIIQAGHVQEALTTIQMRECEMRLELLRICDRNAFLTYCKGHPHQELGERHYEGDVHLFEFFERYAQEQLPAYDHFEQYQRYLHYTINPFFSKVLIPAWIEATNGTLRKQERACFGDLIEAVKGVTPPLT